jgi:hypothetical protein
MQFDVKAVENIISSSPRKNGCFNLFFKLNDKIGIKLCYNKCQRDSNYKNQENASKFGLGPDVYGMIDNVNYEEETYYGYFTEIVWVLEDYNNIPDDFWDLMHHTFQEDRVNLKSDLMHYTGFNFSDNHHANIGVKDGKLVCIDFDVPNESEFLGYSEAL